MKKIILTMLTSLFCINIYSQRTCGSELNLEQIRRTEPLKYQRIMNWENQIKLHSRSVPSSTILIPVVVHVVYNNSAQNISDAQIISQIQVLNEDFRRMNADRANTPSAFANLAGNANIEFKLARRDPNGNTTNGITRTSTSTETFSMEMDNVKFSNLGGNNAWNTRRYLNIWVCNLDDDLLGYAQFPFELQTKPNTDGVVISYRCFGRDGSAVSPFHKGRTTTHEVGHWLNLYHIWGDDDIPDEECVSDECSGTDHVADTPNQGERSLGCPSFPKTDCCTTTSPGVMFMNYMDYTDDACMNLFTKGQVERMRSLFDTQTGIRREMQIYANELTTPVPIGIPRVSLDPPAMTCLSFGSTRTFRAVNEFGQSLCNNSNVREIEWKIFDYSSNPPSMIQNYTTANCNNLLKESLSMYIHSHYQPYVLEFVCRAKSNSGTWGEWGAGHAYMVRSNCSSPQNIFNAYFDQSSATAIVSLTEEYYIIKEAAQQARLFKERAQLGAFQHSSLRQNDKEDSYDIELWNTNQRIRSFRTDEPTFQIPMAGLPAGLYFVRVIKDGQTYTQKLIKK